MWCLVDGGIGKEPLQILNGSQNGFSNGNHSADASILDPTISDGRISTKINEKSRILVGVHATGEWWTRSYIESQGMCSLASPEMDPEIMMQTHSDVSLVPPYKVN